MAKISNPFADAFSAIDKLNEDSAILSDSALSVVDNYIDTGSLALNAIISGSLYKGVPQGRIIGLVGPTGCGKTLILNKIIGNAQKKDPNVWGVIWDSENALDPQIARNVGADPNRIKHNPVDTVEACRNQICAFLDKIIEDKSLHGKVIIGIDSLGNLASTKEINDASAGKDAIDMGTRAKTIKSMMRTLTYKCAKAGVTLIFTNHVYDDPMSMYPSMIKNQSGGKGPMYLASVLVQLSVKQEKEDANDDENDAIIPLANKVKGITISAMTVKNRFTPPFLKTELYLNFLSGLYKYAGLLDMAIAYKVIIQNGPTYALPDGEKLGYLKTWKNNTELWEKKILPELDKVLQKELIFSSSVNELNIEDINDTSDEQA